MLNAHAKRSAFSIACIVGFFGCNLPERETVPDWKVSVQEIPDSGARDAIARSWAAVSGAIESYTGGRCRPRLEELIAAFRPEPYIKELLLGNANAGRMGAEIFQVITNEACNGEDRADGHTWIVAEESGAFVVLYEQRVVEE